MSAMLRRTSIALTAFCSLFVSAAPLRSDDGAELGRALLRATVRAVELEIQGTKTRLKVAETGTGPRENVERFRQRLAALETEHEELSNMKAEEYPRPVKRESGPRSILEESAGFGPVLPPEMTEVAVTVERPCAEGTLLPVVGASRSGPFYHPAGIKGGDYGVLTPGRRVRLTVYLVYRREYFGLIGDYYVYVADVK